MTMMTLTHFRAPENAKSAHFQGPKMGLEAHKSKNGDHFFTPPSPQNGGLGMCVMCLPLLMRNNQIHILASECKKGIFFKMVAKLGKCPKIFSFCCRNGLYTCWYKIYQEAMRPFSNLGTPYFKNTDTFSFYHFY